MTTRTVVGTWRQANQTTPAVGKILFQPVSRVVSSGAYIALPSPPIVATLNNSGAISVSLPVTDEGEPEGWLYRVIEQVGHGSARYYIEVPAGASALDLTTVVPVDVADGGPAYAAFTPQTRTISAGTGLTGGGDLSADRTIGIAAGGVGTTQLADDAVTADKLAPNSVTSDAIAPGVVVESDVADASISTAKVQDAAITTGKLSAGVNTSLGLADGSAQKSANLSDLASASAARTNLGLGSAATTDATAYATSAQGTKADGAAQKASNLSDLASASSARTNLGLGTAATTAASDYATAAQGAKADTAVQPSRTVSAGTGMTGGGDLSADRTLALANTAVTAGNYGLAASVPTLTVDAQGRITAASNTSIAITASQVTGTAITAADTGTVTNTMLAGSITAAKLDNGHATFSNADATVAATTRRLDQTGTLSAPRTVTLPAANAVAAGSEIVIADVSGSVTATNTITIARAGSDTINGGTSEVMRTAYSFRRMVSDGTSKWTFDGGILRAGRNLADVASASTALSNLGGTPTTRTLTAGSGLTGGGDLSADRTLSIATGGVTSAMLADGAVTVAKSSLTAADVGASWTISKSGTWTTGNHAALTTTTMVESRLLGSLFPVTRTISLDRIGITITSSGSAGAVIRLGIYKADDNGVDYTKVLDAGTVDGTQAAGDYSITIDQALTAGLYLLVGVCQGGATTRPTVRATGNASGLTYLLSGNTQAAVTSDYSPVSLFLGGVTGALGSSITPVRNGIGLVISVRIK